MFADVAVLLHVAAGLAEKPDRGAVDGLAQAGAEESVTAGKIAGQVRILMERIHTLSILACGRERRRRERCGAGKGGDVV